jgi:16S rRNA (adenine1518-N6/adenine1519-N6)-dimethyltransferase
MRKRTYRSDTAVGSRVGPGEEGAGAHQRPSALLAAAGVRPSKGRGQNFLVQAAIAERIVATAELTRDDEVIEIGPGLGILTERILAHPLRALRLIELDSRLASHLKERLGGAPNLEIIEADVLKFDLAGAIERSPVKILGNLPFNVAAAVLRKLSDYRQLISRMVLMFQREVADRIRAKPDEPDYAALSVYTALDWEIERHFRVDAGSFHPRPKVDAEVLVFAARANPVCETAERQRVLEVIRAGFSNPRKMLRNNLGASLELPAVQVQAALERAAIDSRARAEALSVLDFVRLARCLDREREMVE